MRLTALLFRRNRMPHGHILMGKDRFVKDVSPKARREAMWRMEVEERNMLLLRHPYLTEEQSAGHTSSLQSSEKFIRRVHDNYRLCRKDDVTIGERFKHLMVTDTWETYKE